MANRAHFCIICGSCGIDRPVYAKEWQPDIKAGKRMARNVSRDKPVDATEGDLILGIDPGTAICGYGLIRVSTEAGDGPADPELATYGVLTTPAGQPLAQRLLSLYTRLNDLLAEYQPAEVAVEELFFNRNTTTALAVGQARGVILLAAAARTIPLYEYTPLQVKQALSGYGRATKDQMQEMVRLAFDLDQAPEPDDAADALAIALCHSRSRRWHSLGLTS